MTFLPCSSASVRARKAQRKPLDLLRLLVALGPKPVREERLADLLWPDSSGDAAQFSLTTTIHRLRRLLGSDEAIVRFDRGVSLSTEVCWVDVFRLRELMAQLEQSQRVDEEVISVFDEMVGLYHGPLLPDGDSAAVARERERLARRILTQIQRVVPVIEKSGQSEVAHRACLVAVHIDPSFGHPVEH